MINQEKVRDMSRMAMLESGQGKKELMIGTLNPVSYVIRQLVIGAVTGTVCYIAVFFLWFALKWDHINEVFADGDYFGFFNSLAKYYLVFLICYLALSTLVALWRYRRCKEKRQIYTKYLRRLNQAYEDDDNPGNEA